MTEGLSLATSAKLTVSEHLVTHNGQMSHVGVGFQSPAATENVSSVTIDEKTGNIMITFTPLAGDGTIVLHPELLPSGQIKWSCTDGTLNANYRPSHCK